MKDNQYGIWIRAGHGKGSPQTKQSTSIHNPQRHCWRIQNDEWKEKERSNIQELTQEGPTINIPTKAKGQRVKEEQ